MHCPAGLPANGPDHHDGGHTFGVAIDGRVPRHEARQAERPELSRCPNIVDEALALPFALGPEFRRGQHHLMVDLGHVLGGNADLDHLDAVARLQHAVADFGGLDEAVARVQPDGSALILVDHVDPAPDAEDQLEAHLVEMHHVRHRPAIRNADVGRNHRAAQT